MCFFILFSRSFFFVLFPFNWKCHVAVQQVVQTTEIERNRMRKAFMPSSSQFTKFKINCQRHFKIPQNNTKKRERLSCASVISFSAYISLYRTMTFYGVFRFIAFDETIFIRALSACIPFDAVVVFVCTTLYTNGVGVLCTTFTLHRCYFCWLCLSFAIF